jgi:hypothetical protein
LPSGGAGQCEGDSHWSEESGQEEGSTKSRETGGRQTDESGQPEQHIGGSPLLSKKIRFLDEFSRFS